MSAVDTITRRTSISPDDSLGRPRTLLAVVALGLAGTFVVTTLVHWEGSGWLALDLKLGAAQRLVDGETLYPADGSAAYPYPPLWAMLVTPFLLLPELVAQYAAAFLCAAAVLAAIWIVGVRDPVCFALALGSASLGAGARLANVSCVIALLIALAYRCNGAPSGIAIALKLYAWPLLLWGWLTRGRRDAILGAATAAAAILIPWALIGFDGITRYIDVARRVTHGQGAHEFPVWLAATLTVLALVAMWWKRRDSIGSLSFAVLAMLAASPVVWSFYYTAAFVPLALTRPKLSLAWFVPVAMWGTGNQIDVALTMGLLAWCGVSGHRSYETRHSPALPAPLPSNNGPHRRFA